MDASASNRASDRSAPDRSASDRSASTDDRVTANDVVATYPDLESARAAITLLERHGVEAGNIELQVPGADPTPLTDDAQRDADMEATGQVGKRASVGLAGGALIGAVVGALLGAAASALLDIATPLALAFGGALGGAAFGAFAGGFYGGATGLPVTEAWGESYNAEHAAGGAPRLAVHSDHGGAVDDVVQALRGTGPLSLRRADGEGRLADA